jgi:hypothetical protein
MEFKLKIPRHPRDVLYSLRTIEWKLPRKPRDIAIAAAAGVVLIISLGWMISALHTSRASNPEYFTTDDGHTYFTVSGPHFAPFNYYGKEAVQAILFQGSDGKPFVGYLMKYSPGAQRALASASNGQASNGGAPAAPILDEDRLVKRPGEREWLPSNNRKAPDIWGTATDQKTKAQVPRWQGW